MIFIILFSLGARAEKMGFPSINDVPSEYVVLKYGKIHFSLLTFKNLKLSKLNGDIHSIYQDDDELVVFLQNGLNLYYNKFNKKKFLLTKIISPDENSRKLVKSTMNLRTVY